MPMTPINPAGFPVPLAPYSAGTRANDTIYVSGILPINEDGSVAHVGDVSAQTRHVLESVKKVIEAGGGTMADVAFNHIYLTDWANYAQVNSVYAEFFPGDKPARFCICCTLVKPEFLIEIASVAHVGQG